MPLPVWMRALMGGGVTALLCVLSWDHPNPRNDNSKQDAANNTINDAQAINITSDSTLRGVQAYKRQCITSDNYDDTTDGENIFQTSTATE
ncbi:hypothetical protein BJY52DRAFT_1296409 [Lactarius psammicola]|nr:hypothetical protein BJY52DRAFT_1296409 [Lactarius psammicola]